MKAIKFALPLMLAMLVSISVTGADGDKPKADKPKGDRPPGAVGTLAEKPADAKPGVVAVLKTKKGDTINLLAEGDVATQIAEGVKTGAVVRVVGEKTPDGIKVTKVAKPGDGPKKPGGNKPGDKPAGDKPADK